MSSTRYAADGEELQQQRWASSPDFSTSINALIAAKRIALIENHELRELLWFIQWRSLETGGLRRLANELSARFPERVGTPRMRSANCQPVKILSRKETIAIREEFPLGTQQFRLRGEPDLWSDEYGSADAPRSYQFDDFCQALAVAVEGLPEHLLRLCVNPGIKLDSFESDDAAVWYFNDLLSALKQIRSGGAGATILADTETNRQIHSALDFCFRRRRMILIEGKAGIGKTAALRAWCDQRRGLARYVEVPSSNDDRSFFAAIAETLGVARGTSYNGQQIKLRVEEALRVSGLMLVFDESQFLWPQYIRPQGIPARMQWIKTAFDAGTPIALAALPKFSEWQELYAKRTLWDDDQLERRLNRKVMLPDAHSQEDLLKIARTRHPNGDKASWKLLAGYALAATKKQASAITEALESAADIAQQAGRDAIGYDDIYAAMQNDFKALPRSSSITRRASSLQSACRHTERPLQSREASLTTRHLAFSK
jgi:hypothetical protein